MLSHRTPHEIVTAHLHFPTLLDDMTKGPKTVEMGFAVLRACSVGLRKQKMFLFFQQNNAENIPKFAFKVSAIC